MRTVRRIQQLPINSTPFSKRYGLMGESIVVETNHEPLLEVADAAFGRFALQGDEERPPIRLRVLRHDEPPSGARFTHRTDGHFYVIGSGDDVAVLDGQAGTAVAHVSSATAADTRLVRYTFIEGPALAAVMDGRGYVVVHACGIARNGRGLAVMGDAGAGKSTLALAAARHGFDVFAEDGVFVCAGQSGIEFWGMPWTQRLVLDALRFFPELAGQEPIRQPNGEMKVEVDLDRWFPGRATPSARPAAVVLLGRGSGTAKLERATEVEELPFLWPWGDNWTQEHEQTARAVAELPMFRLELGGSPSESMPLLDELFDELAAL